MRPVRAFRHNWIFSRDHTVHRIVSQSNATETVVATNNGLPGQRHQAATSYSS